MGEEKWFVITGHNEADTPILLFTSEGVARDYCSRNPSTRGYSIYRGEYVDSVTNEG